MIHLTAPGVYIQEVPSGVHTISGVATSITAFIGRAASGAADTAVTVYSFSEFARQFGSIDHAYPMTYAVNDFFLNGGATAVIVRLAHGATTASVVVDGITIDAASPGTWANKYKLTILASTADALAAQALGVTGTARLFDLQVFDTSTGAPATPIEWIRNVAVDDVPRRLDRVLAQESALFRVRKPFPATPAAVPGNGDVALSTQGAAETEPLVAGTIVSDAIALLDHVDTFNLLVIPPDTFGTDTLKAVATAAAAYCTKRRAVLIADPLAASTATSVVGDIGGYGIAAGDQRNVAVYFPMLKTRDPLDRKTIEVLPAAGAVAGVIAQTDAQRGVWKAPAGLDAGLATDGVAVPLSDGETGAINSSGINCLRTFPNAGTVVWGARTLRGADNLSDDYKYLPVRRTALYLEESLYRGTQWVVFEPNAEPLWSQIRLNVGSFMHSLFRQGAFAGVTPQQAYLVKCDRETTTADDVNRGIVNIIVGFAPLKPAEFVVIKIEQLAGESAG